MNPLFWVLIWKIWNVFSKFFQNKSCSTASRDSAETEISFKELKSKFEFDKKQGRFASSVTFLQKNVLKTQIRASIWGIYSDYMGKNLTQKFLLSIRWRCRKNNYSKKISKERENRIGRELVRQLISSFFFFCWKTLLPSFSFPLFWLFLVTFPQFPSLPSSIRNASFPFKSNEKYKTLTSMVRLRIGFAGLFWAIWLLCF